MAKAHAFTDNFNDNTTNTTLWTAYNEAKEVNQRLELRPVSTSSTQNYVSYESVNAYDLTGSSITKGNGLNMTFDSGMIRFRKKVTTTVTALAQAPYDPVLHRWWRIREAGGVTYWELSRDGRVRALGHSTPNPVPLASLRIGIVAGAYHPTTPGGRHPLRHDAVGDPEPHSYGTLLRALQSRDPGDFEEIILAPNALKLTNPQAAWPSSWRGRTRRR